MRLVPSQLLHRHHGRPPSLKSRSIYTTPDKLSRPFTRTILEEIRGRLSPAPGSEFATPPHTVSFIRRPASEAAVLIPLMNIGDVPHVLLEVRAAKMRTHAGEISFPGGKVDPEDRSLADAALRETYEELRIPPANVEILGMLNRPEYSLGNKARVWPIVGFVHDSSSWTSTSRQLQHSLRSLPLSALQPSPEEVATILPLPLPVLSEKERRRVHHFRVDPARPYYTLKAGDLVLQSPGQAVVDPGLEVWGLSGWVLNRLAWRLGWMDRPRVEEYQD